MENHAHAAIAGFFANLARSDTVRVEHDAVVHGNSSDLAECRLHRLHVAGSEAQEVGIARGPVWHVVPEGEEQRPLEQEALGMG